MGALVLDASVVIAFSEADDALHDAAVGAAAQAWQAGSTRLLPASAYSEILVRPIQRGTGDRIDAFLAASAIEVVPIDAAIARAAAAARVRCPNLRLPDALVIATALAHDAELVTLDTRMTAAFEQLRA